MANTLIVWVAIPPADTLSVLANTLISTLILAAAGRRVEELLSASWSSQSKGDVSVD